MTLKELMNEAATHPDNLTSGIVHYEVPVFASLSPDGKAYETYPQAVIGIGYAAPKLYVLWLDFWPKTVRMEFLGLWEGRTRWLFKTRVAYEDIDGIDDLLGLARKSLNRELSFYTLSGSTAENLKTNGPWVEGECAVVSPDGTIHYVGTEAEATEWLKEHHVNASIEEHDDYPLTRRDGYLQDVKSALKDRGVT